MTRAEQALDLCTSAVHKKTFFLYDIAGFISISLFSVKHYFFRDSQLPPNKIDIKLHPLSHGRISLRFGSTGGAYLVSFLVRGKLSDVDLLLLHRTSSHSR